MKKYRIVPCLAIISKTVLTEILEKQEHRIRVKAETTKSPEKDQIRCQTTVSRETASPAPNDRLRRTRRPAALPDPLQATPGPVRARAPDNEPGPTTPWPAGPGDGVAPVDLRERAETICKGSLPALAGKGQSVGEVGETATRGETRPDPERGHAGQEAPGPALRPDRTIRGAGVRLTGAGAKPSAPARSGKEGTAAGCKGKRRKWP